jgi:hypothetical protein
VRILRSYFALPEPLPVPSGTVVIETVGREPQIRLSDDPWVCLRFHQVTIRGMHEQMLAEAVHEVTRSIACLPGNGSQSNRAGGLAPDVDLGLSSYLTVVEAMTVFESPEGQPDDWSGRAQDLNPRSDPFLRCFRLVQDHARAYRLAVDARTRLLTYERLAPFVVSYLAELDQAEQSALASLFDDSNIVWKGPALVLLEHMNLAAPSSEPEIRGDLAERTRFWLTEIRAGGQLMVWREQLLTAQHLSTVEGDHAAGVVFAQTASETFLDVLLELLMWEERQEPLAVAPKFAEGEFTQRVKAEFAGRLGGRWSLDGAGVVASWFHGCSRLRHRIVHGGVQPSRSEAESAIDSVFSLQAFAFDRLTAKRTTYPRTTLMTVAESGLRRRGLWSGGIKRFAENDARTEPSWRQAFREWHDVVSEASRPS